MVIKRLPQWVCWVCAGIVALIALGIVVLVILNPVPVFGSGYSCETRLAICYKGMTAAIERAGPKHDATYPLARSLNDAFGPCEWEGPVYRCQNAP